MSLHTVIVQISKNPDARQAGRQVVMKVNSRPVLLSVGG